MTIPLLISLIAALGILYLTPHHLAGSQIDTALDRLRAIWPPIGM